MQQQAPDLITVLSALPSIGLAIKPFHNLGRQLQLLGQTVAATWADSCSCLGRLLQLLGQTVAATWADCCSCLGRLLQLLGPTVAVAWADCFS